MSIGLVIVDTYPNKRFLEWAAHQCIQKLKFDDIYIFSDENFLSLPHWYKIPRISSVARYSDIVIRVLPYVVQTDFILIIQWDGFIIDDTKWTNEFLLYDYIGAPWEDHLSYFNVGNGGFSLRSSRLLETIRSELSFFVLGSAVSAAEDEVICKVNRGLLESRGIRFAPTEIARSFSYEGRVFNSSFGFHGPKNVARFTPEKVLIEHHLEILERISHPSELLNFLLNLRATAKLQALSTFLETINSKPPLLHAVKYLLDNYSAHRLLNTL